MIKELEESNTQIVDHLHAAKLRASATCESLLKSGSTRVGSTASTVLDTTVPVEPICTRQ
eukprot:c44749_g1_i1 orf=340-519(+)